MCYISRYVMCCVCVHIPKHGDMSVKTDCVPAMYQHWCPLFGLMQYNNVHIHMGNLSNRWVVALCPWGILVLLLLFDIVSSVIAHDRQMNCFVLTLYEV